MNSEEQLKEIIFEHCLGKGSPSTELLERGSFPPNWVTRYISLVERATKVWGDKKEWPREVVGSLHFASFYLEIRFDAWRRASGKDNPNTRRGLGEIRRCSEVFLLSSLKNEAKIA